MGDARYNMGRSLMVGCAKMGLQFTACAPQGYMPPEDLIEVCQKIAAETGAVLSFESDPKTALAGADVVYTDIWVSMGEPEEEWAKRIPLMMPYQVNRETMAMAKNTAVFMHCLPSYHDERTGVGKAVSEKFGLHNGIEVTDEVFESDASIVFEEAENRMHTIKAVIAAVL
jgi:ornithine carbamoyltransferase